jgi:hypothetical protein
MNELHTQIGLKLALDEITRKPVRRPRNPWWRQLSRRRG